MAKRKLAKTIEEITERLEFLLEYPDFEFFIEHGYSDDEAEAFLNLITTVKKISPEFNNTFYCNECDERYENPYPKMEHKGNCPYCSGEKERPQVKGQKQ